MSTLELLALAAVALWLSAVLVLVLLGRREDARALAGLVPDCAALFGRLMRDGAVPRRRRLLLAGLVVYLALPIDLVPDFIPVAGHLDDAMLVTLVLRRLVREHADRVVLHWPGPASSLALLLRIAGAQPPQEASQAAPALTSASSSLTTRSSSSAIAPGKRSR